jgi:hypothetical protein
MAFNFVEPQSGFLQIANTDAGLTYTAPNGTTTIIPTPPSTLGMTARSFDPTLGEGEFIMLKGVAGTVVGSLVTYDATAYTTALCPVTANLARPVAVAMAANTSATAFSWYQLSGSATVAKSVNHNIQPNLAVGVFSAGKIAAGSSAGAGKEIEGARYSSTTTASSASTTCVIIMNRPHMQGRIT